MKQTWKKYSVYIVAVVVAAVTSVGVYKYMEYARPYSVADTIEQSASVFGQKNVLLASNNSGGYPDFTVVSEKAVHAVVHIKSTISVKPRPTVRKEALPAPFDFFFGDGAQGGGFNFGQQQPRVGSGSGVIISADGYVITNNHVIDKATEIEVTLNNNEKHIARLVGSDPNTDIALLKIDVKDQEYLSFGNSDELKVGEWVLAIGNPFNLTSTVTAGIVSAKGRGGIGGGEQSIQSFIQTDAAINPGNSGGALINIKGDLVGINTAIYSQTGSFAGYGFAVPISIAGKVVADLKEHGTVQRAMLGVSIQDVSIAKELDKEKTAGIEVSEGVYVGGFGSVSPARDAGVKEGDVIVAVNGAKTNNTGALQEQISKYRPGQKIKLDVLRKDKKMSFDVVLKNSDGTTSIVKKVDGIEAVGAAFKELSAERKKELGIQYGVEVSGTDKAGKFEANGLTRGFIILEINEIPVKTPEEVEAIISEIAKSKDKVLFIKGLTSTGKRKYAAVELVD